LSFRASSFQARQWRLPLHRRHWLFVVQPNIACNGPLDLLVRQTDLHNTAHFQGAVESGIPTSGLMLCLAAQPARCTTPTPANSIDGFCLAVVAAR